MAEQYSKIGELVPSLFYDVIARIVPGAAVVTIVAYLRRFHPPLDQAERVVLIIGGGYIVGLLLSAVSTGILWGLTRRRQWRSYSDEHFWTYIRVHHADRELTALLAKMVAESTCCENLVVATPVVAMLDPNRAQRIHVYVAAVVITLYVAYVRREILKRRLETQ